MKATPHQHRRPFSPTLLIVGLLLLAPASWLSAQPSAGGDLPAMFESGVEAYQQGRLDEAETFFEKCVELDPNFAPAYNYLGLVHQSLHSPLTDIIWLYNVAVEIDPGYAEAYLNRCRAYSEAGHPEEAAASCRKALEINPGMGSAELSLGWIYLMGQSDPRSAIPYFESVVNRGVRHPMVYRGLGMAYAMDGNRGKALEVITELRAMGEEEIAVRLEQALRQSAGAQGLPAAIPQVPDTAPGQLVPAQPRPPVQTAAAPPGVNGMMRVRLRGRLSNSPEAMAAQQAAAQEAGESDADDQWHPGSLSVEPGAQGSGEESAIDRIRRLQRLRSTVPVQVR